MFCRYVNTAEEPSLQTRTVSFTVNDGVFNSTAAVTSIIIVAMNDPPIVMLEQSNANTLVTYLEGQKPLLLAPQLNINGTLNTNSFVSY